MIAIECKDVRHDIKLNVENISFSIVLVRKLLARYVDGSNLIFLTYVFSYQRQAIVFFVVVFLVCNPFLVYANGITVDSSAPIIQRPALDVAQNGVPVVNITAPSSGGVSRNSFADFNVDQHGVVINNSSSIGISQLGGVLTANPNFSGNTARIILNEVTGVSRSNIAGATEIFGDKAEYILANPNGISCNGCSFINTPRVTLSTGVVDLENGKLKGLDVIGGDIKFEGADINVQGLDAFDIISQAASFASSVYAGKELNIITGINYVEYSNNSITAKFNNTDNHVAVDTSVLGGMYAGKINLVVTESGVGVNSKGKLVSDTDIIITSDGTIEYQDANAKGDIKITSQNGSVKHSGNSYSEGKTEIIAKDNIEIADGFTASKDGIVLNSNSLNVDNQASLMAGVDAKIIGSKVSFTDNNLGSINLATAVDANNYGLISGGQINASTGSFNNFGTLQSLGAINIKATAGVINNNLINGSDIIVYAKSFDNSNSYAVDTEGNLNSGLITRGGIYITTSAGVNNSSGAISAKFLTINTSGEFINDFGLFNSADSITIHANGVSNNDSAGRGIQALSNIIIKNGFTNFANNNGIIIANGAIDISDVSSFSNSGIVSGAGNVNITADTIDNSHSYRMAANSDTLDRGIISNGLINLTANNFINNNDGAVFSENLNLYTGILHNISGFLQAKQGVHIVAAEIDNSNTYIKSNVGGLVKGIIAASGITLVTTGDIDNTNGAISSGGSISTVSDGVFVNHGLLQSSRDTSITTYSIDNSNSYHKDTNDRLDSGIITGGKLVINALGDINNNNGALYSLVDIALTSGQQIQNSGLIQTANLLYVTAGDISNSGIISADSVVTTANGINNSGFINGNTKLEFTANITLQNIGLIKSSGDITFTASNINNQDSYSIDANGLLNKGIITSGNIFVNASNGNVNNSNGAITASNIAINALAFINNYGLVQSFGDTNITTFLIDNSNSKAIVAGGDVNLNSSSLINNNNGVVAAAKIDITAGQIFSNIAGTVSGVNNITIHAIGIDNSDSYALNNAAFTKGILTSGTTWLYASGGDIVNTNGVISSGEIILSTTANIINNGIIQSDNNINITSDTIDNSNSYTVDINSKVIKGIIAGKDANVNAARFNNSSGAILGDNVNITTGVFNNIAGLSQSTNYTNIKADSISNDNSYITGSNGQLIKGIISGSDLSLAAVRSFSNDNGAVLGNDKVTIESGEFTNNGLVQSNGLLKLTSAHINNSGYANKNGYLNKGLIASDAIDLSAVDITNTGAISAGYLQLRTTGKLINKGILQSFGDIFINSEDLDNSESYTKDSSSNLIGGILSGGSVNVGVSKINNNNGAIAGNDVNISDSGILENTSGLIQAASSINIAAININNSHTNVANDNNILTKGIISLGNLNLTATTNGIDNTDGAISSDADTVISVNGLFSNNSIVQAGSNLSITSGVIDNSNSYVVNKNILAGGLIAGGTIKLDAGVKDINNNFGSISAGKTFSLSGGNINNDNGYVSANGVTGTSLAITTNQLNNKSGSFLSKSSLTVSGVSGDNTAGGVISAKDALTVSMSGGQMLNSGGNIYSSAGAIAAQNINNNSGYVQGSTKVTITQTNGVFDNTNGKVLSVASGSEVTINAADNILNQNGHITSVQDTYLNTTGSYNLTGNITTGGYVDITAGSIANSAIITAGNYISLNARQGDVTNNTGAKLISGTSVTINAQGNINNNGEVSGPILTLNASTGSLNNYSLITSSGNLDINVLSAEVNNYGRISAEGNANINAASINNSSAQVASNNNLNITTTGYISNSSGLLYATNNLNLHASNIENLYADIFSLNGNITLDKITGVKNSSITNSSSTIEAMSGDVIINTSNINNSKYGASSNGNVSIAQPPATTFNGETIYNYNIDWLNSHITGFTGADIPGQYYNLGGSYFTWIFRIQGSANGNSVDSSSGFINAGRDITINTGNFSNLQSQLAANRNVTINATGTVNNNAQVYQEWAHYYDATAGHWYNSIQDPNFNLFIQHATIQGNFWFATTPLQTVTISSTVHAGNNLSIAGNLINNSSSFFGGAPLPTANTSASTTGGPVSLVIVNDKSLTQVQAEAGIVSDTLDSSPIQSGVQASSGNGISGTNLATNKYAKSSDTNGLPLAVPLPVQNAIATININPLTTAISLIKLPIGDNGLFRVNTAPAANYLIESNVAFLDQRRFLGSDYFLSRIGYTIPSNYKLLGDAFYETRLIKEQVFARTGRRYINDSIGTDLVQMQALMDNAIAAQSKLNLSVGIELSSAQVAVLSSDIIWPVLQTIDGQQVLVPVLYLAQATLNGISGKGAIISASHDLTVTAEDSIVNNSEISAGHDLILTAGNGITNDGGLIKAGNNISLTAINGDIVNSSVVNSSANTSGTYTREYIQSRGVINAGGDLSLSAGNDVITLAGITTAAGGVNINAGNDISISGTQLHNLTETGDKKNHYSLDNTTTHENAEIVAGGSISITSGNNTVMQASRLSAGGDVDINASGTIALLATVDTALHDRQDSSSSLLWQSSSGNGTYAETVSHVAITAGGNVNITGTDGVVVQYKDTGNLNDSIAQLSKASELAWMVKLQSQDNVEFQAVAEAYNSWNYSQSGLTPAGAAIIAIAVSAATAGAAAPEAFAGAAGAAVTSMGASAAVATAASAATMAAMSALASQAAVSLVNNKGDIGKTLKDLSTSETAKSMAFAALTAGATAGIGNEIVNATLGTAPITPGEFKLVSQASQAVTNAATGAGFQSIIYNQDFQELFKKNLVVNATYAVSADAAQYVGNQYHTAEYNAVINGTTISLGDEVMHIAAHAAIGCVAGSVTVSDCKNGAIGGVFGEIGAQVSGNLLDTGKQANAYVGQYAALSAALFAGADATGIYTANGTALNAIQNNYLTRSHFNEWRARVEKECGANIECRKDRDNQFYTAEKMAEEIGFRGNPDLGGCDSLCHQMVRDFNYIPEEALFTVAPIFLNGIIEPYVENLRSLETYFLYSKGEVDPKTGEFGLYDTRTGERIDDAALNVTLILLDLSKKFSVKNLYDYALRISSNVKEARYTLLYDDANLALPEGSFALTTHDANLQLPESSFARNAVNLPSLREELKEAITIINPDRSEFVNNSIYDRNCANCAMALENTLRGYPSSAVYISEGLLGSHARGTTTEYMEYFYDSKFEDMHSMSDITKTMKNAGPDSIGIVRVTQYDEATNGAIAKIIKDRKSGMITDSEAAFWTDYTMSRSKTVGHVFNVVNKNGQIFYIDSQSGGLFKPNAIYEKQALMTLRPLNDPRSYFTLDKMQGVGFKPK